MQVQTVEAGKGLAWFGAGWQIFMRNPGMWVVGVILLLVMAAVLHLVPVLGPLLFTLLLPGLVGGMLHAARELAEGREMDISQFFIAFRENDMRNATLVLGAVLIGANILFMFLALVLAGGGMGMVGMMHGGNEHLLAAGFGIGMLLALLLMMVVGTLLTMALLYAVPLVMFAAAKPAAAMKSSFTACLVNILPLLLFSVVYLVLALVAALPLGLGFLILLPVTFGAIYASYRDIYVQPPAP